jgi:hypothetical protein
MDPRDVWAATRRPPNVPDTFAGTFSDLYWKTYGIVHHASRIIALEQTECADLVERLRRQANLIGIAQTCSSTIRFEYEAMLGAAYGAQSLLARAVVESLEGVSLESAKLLPSFGGLDRAIKKLRPLAGMVAARDRVRAALTTITTWKSPDFFEVLTPRNRVVHREHLRCTPIFACRVSGVRMIPDRTESLGVRFATSETINSIIQYAPDVEMGFILLTRADDQPVPPGEIWLSPAREVAQAKLSPLSSRALEVAQQHLLAAALMLDALSEGDDPTAGIITRREAAGRAKAIQD